jgi:hypothetical protein
MFTAMMDRHAQEMQDAIDADPTGDGFIYDMFNEELANHEYCITNDITDALNALNLSIEEINADVKLQHGLKKAAQAQENFTC